jgi:hypothetical protein
MASRLTVDLGNNLEIFEVATNIVKKEVRSTGKWWFSVLVACECGDEPSGSIKCWEFLE